MDSKISSGVLVQVNGRGFLFQALVHCRRSASSAVTVRWAERRSLRLVSSANHRSTRLSQEALAGVKCRWNRGWRSSHFLTSGVVRVA
jgi:hypothetical protein